MRNLVPLSLATFLLAATGVAQTPPGLIGLSRNLPVLMQFDTSTCLPQRCLPPIPALPTLPAFAGGTAYDPVRGATWITNGMQIALVAQGTCAPLCPPMPLPLPAGAVATGLAYNEIASILFVSDSMNFIHWFKVSGCTLMPLGSCQTWPVSAGNPTIGGIATDDVAGLVFYSGSMWTGAPNNIVFVAKQTSPCQYFCKIPLQSCPGTTLGPITGLAHDCCKNVLWATDGLLHVGSTYRLATCTANPFTCCRNPVTSEPLIGLCMLPSIATTKDQTATSKSCTAPSCPVCPTMAHSMIGQPTLGNPGFQLRLDNAPGGASAILLLNVGPCGVGVPFACGQIFVPLPGLVALGPFPTGGAGCGGSHGLTLSLAPNPAFCGFTLSTQYAVVCPGAPIGIGLSNCLSWMISGT